MKKHFSPKSLRRPLLIAAVNLVCIFFLVIETPFAHVGGHMPDSEAEMEYRILLEFKPKDFATRAKLGLVLMNQDKLKEAEKEFEKALALDPKNLQAHLGMSLLRLKQKRTDEALQLIKKAQAIAPGHPGVYLNYGMILESANRPDEAMKMYNEGLGKIPTGSGNPEAEDDRKQLETARQSLKEKLENPPGKTEGQ